MEQAAGFLPPRTDGLPNPLRSWCAGGRVGSTTHARRLGSRRNRRQGCLRYKAGGSRVTDPFGVSSANGVIRG